MTVWSHLPTIFKRRRVLQTAGIITLCVALITTLFFVGVSHVHAVASTNRTVSYQGRLLTSGGAVVPDGHYNIEFKIYQGGSGSTAGDTDGGTLKWTEDYTTGGTSGGVEVRNGYWAVNLGSVNPFGTSVDWDQDDLWISMNIAGVATGCTTFGSGPCTADGEMLPMKQITATPYAINAGQLGGKTAADFIQNGTSPQTGNFNISGTGTASTLQGNTSVISPLFDGSPAGTLNVGTQNATTINVGTNDADHTINIGTGDGGSHNQVVTIGSTAGYSSTTIQGGGGLGVRINTSSGFTVHDANSETNHLIVDGTTGTTINLDANTNFTIYGNMSGGSILQTTAAGNISTNTNSILTVNGLANFNHGITIQGTGTYYTPKTNYGMSSAVVIPNYTVPAYGSVFAFGLPSGSDATARGLAVADARTGIHQATIGVFSPNEDNILGMSWTSDVGTGNNAVGTLTNTGNTLALQGNGLNLLTATNNGGQANVGIGNTASNGYALDVTGNTNTSGSYYIGGSSVLGSNSLNFYGAAASTITSASGQSLNVNSSNGVNIQVGGTNIASAKTGQLQIGSGSGTGQPTLLTLDKASSTPTATGSNLVGSMYYDTSKNAVQCYNGSSWGACASSPDSFVTISPEYAGAVLQGSGNGTMTAGLCSDTLHINDGTSGQPTICGSGETYNFYKWTASSSTSQSYSIYVTYQLPSTFTSFVAGSTSLMGRTDSSDSSVSYDIYRKNGSGLTACGSTTSVSTGNQAAWQTATASTDPSTCGFTAGDSILVKVNVSAKNGKNAYAGTLNFAFSNQ